MDDVNKVTAKPPGFGTLLAISFGLFNVGFIIEQAVRWTDSLLGFLSGIKFVYASALVWAVFVLPWSLMIAALYRWQKWQRSRASWILAPAVVMLLYSLGITSARISSGLESLREVYSN